jgi:hypothetical protein
VHKKTTSHPIVGTQLKQKIFEKGLGTNAVALIILLLLGCGRIGFELSEAHHPSSDAESATADAGRGAISDAAISDAAWDSEIVARDAETDTAVDATQPANDADSSESGMDSDIDTGSDSDRDVPIDDAGGDADEPPPACADLPDPIDHCLQVPYLSGPPLIEGILDGVIDCAPPLNTIEPMGWTSGEPIPEGNSARYAMGYREDGLYLFVEVTDPDRLPALIDEGVWRGDGVEVYLDSDGDFPNAPDYDNPGTAQFIIAAPEDDTTPSTRATVYRDQIDLGSWDSSRFAAFPTDTGYVLEAWFSADDLRLSSWTLEAGGAIGFNLSIDVSTTPDDLANPNLYGTRIGQYFLHVGGAFCGEPYCSSDAFCSPELRP